ncbi:hypothetical protein [Phormidesmis priestleyi]|uniref:hypothetical protein n=1 Tax=Phormidesmis priestleyi TaxID=268141 RepID=UPI00083AD21F|nr:hypothetical protein [Phormidesmis priestleyi]
MTFVQAEVSFAEAVVTSVQAIVTFIQAEVSFAEAVVTSVQAIVTFVQAEVRVAKGFAASIEVKVLHQWQCTAFNWVVHPRRSLQAGVTHTRQTAIREPLLKEIINDSRTFYS